MKNCIFIVITLIATFSVRSFAQTLSVNQLIRAWNVDDTSQTTQAETTYADLKAHINPQSFASTMRGLSEYLDRHPSPRLQARILIYKILGKGELSLPIDEKDRDDIRQALKLAGLLNDPQLLSEVYTLYGERSDMATELFYDLKAIDMQERIGAAHFPMLWMRYLVVGQALYRFHEFKKSIHYCGRGVTLMKSPGVDVTNYVLLLDDLGASYFALGNADSTRYYYQRINAILFSYPLEQKQYLKIWQGIVKGGEGMALFLQKRYDQALPFLKANKASSYSFGQWGDAAKAENIIAEIHFTEKKYDSALAEWKNVRQWAMRGNDRTRAKVAVGGIRDTYEAMKEFDSAFVYDGLYYAYQDSLIKGLEQYRLAAIQARVEYSNMQVDLLRDKAFIKRQRRTRNMILAFIAVTTILILWLFHSYNNKQLSHQAKLRQDRKLVQQEFDRAKKQMEDFSRNISEKTQIIEELKTRINGREDQTAQACLRRFTILTEEDWRNFKEAFEKAYPGFWERLSHKFPHLTLAEQRFMALSKLGLNNKEMAAASGVSPETIRVLTYRLRKKLSVSETNELVEMAHSI